MDAHKKIREHISALSDGELPDSDLELAAAALRGPDGEATWIAYHRIGDVLRGQQAPEFSPGFNARLAARLAAEAAPMRRVATATGAAVHPAGAAPPATATAATAATAPAPSVGSSLSADGAASVISTTP